MKFTSGGIERGARPICDERAVDVEKDRGARGKAGRRKDGKDIEQGETIALSSPLHLAVENIIIDGVECSSCRAVWNFFQT